MRQNSRWIILGLLVLFALSTALPMFSDMGLGCSPDVPSNPSAEAKKPLPDLDIPNFNSDSAYVFTEKIVGLSPRIVGTEGAMKVKKYVVAQFKKYGAEVIEQPFSAVTFDGKSHKATNIIAQYNKAATNRVVLSCHWDSRPFADRDADEADKNKPILAADDSGSSMGMLIEIARQLQAKPIANLGVDIVFFDAEDYGNPNPPKPKSLEEQAAQGKEWGIGAQYWSKIPHMPGYKALYGINLDMAGAKGARFVKESISVRYAPQVVEKVWRIAQDKYGYVNIFVNDMSREDMTDDHVFVNELAKIPMIDIINHPTDSFFGKYWHTTDDNMSIIDRETLRAVGRTVLATLHYEAAGSFN